MSVRRRAPKAITKHASSRRSHLLSGLLRYDPVPWLLSGQDLAVTTLVRRDLLHEKVDLRPLQHTKEAARLLRRQQPNGSWLYPVRKPPPQNYDLYETFTTLGELVGKYGMDRSHKAIQRAAEYVFSCQTAEGDYRGIYGTQPAHTYTPALMEVLIEAGYAQHPSIQRAFRWLLATRQEDGGWAIAARTRELKLVKEWDEISSGPVIEADPTKPFSHMVTGIVLRAFAAHPRYRGSRAALHAAELFKSRLFKPDRYSDRKGKEYWTKFTYPFQFTDLLTSLDALGKLGFSADDPELAPAVDWFRQRQKPDGSFELNMCRAISDRRLALWLGLGICRALLRFKARG
ncbi:MAG: hypothetical protein JW940_03160 [Polyangiaceae bacterium]|nr:hypothetical protein [Polyangiaceae bacterium]